MAAAAPVAGAPPTAPAGDESPFVLGKEGERRMKGRTITVPVVTGTCAFYLGKKASVACVRAGGGRASAGSAHAFSLLARSLAAAAGLGPAPLPSHPTSPRPAVYTCCVLCAVQASEYQSHKWTVYMRSPTGEDLSHVLKKVCGESLRGLLATACECWGGWRWDRPMPALRRAHLGHHLVPCALPVPRSPLCCTSPSKTPSETWRSLRTS